MGQQQLLLLVLGIVIVGIAVVAGIQAFSEGKTKADRDAAQSDAMRIISDVQAWKLKPAAFGGGANATAADFANVSFTAIGIPPASVTNGFYKTSNACIQLTGSASGATVTTRTVPANGTCSASAGNVVGTATITGSTPSSISWAYAAS